MGLTLRALFLVASATRVFASCAHGTFLQPRAAEGGEVAVSTFGYTGAIVWSPKFSRQATARLTYHRGLSTGQRSRPPPTAPVRPEPASHQLTWSTECLRLSRAPTSK